MKENMAQLKIIRDTVTSSILSEIETELKSSVSSNEKRKEMISLSRSNLESILNKMSNEELLPKGDIDSPENLEDHILKIVKKVKKQLLSKIENEK
jgi:hypothetical protein